MDPTVISQVLAHDESFRAVCARIEDRADFVLVSNRDVSLPETNCALRVRLADEKVPPFVGFVKTHGLSVLLDAAGKPRDLRRRLEDIGLVSHGRIYVALLDPESLVQPPGGSPRFTAVGPSELGKFTELACQGTGEKAAAARLLWSFRLRNLLFSAFVAETPEGSAAAFAIFHCGPLARLVGPFPAGPRTEFVLACRLILKAWERAQEKGAARLYSFVSQEDIDLMKPLGFRIEEGFWLELYAP
jgi:hypothetical protein